MPKFSTTEYRGLQQAFDYFNTELFNKSLPDLMIVLHRKANSLGYFAPKRFGGRMDKSVAHELALNPDHFTGRTDEDILSTLVHEMAHEWQEAHGKPGRGRYHNRQWAEKMKTIGLYPSSTGEPGGKETGDRVSHYILAAGAYASAYAKLKAKGVKLHWQSAPLPKAKVVNSKTPFTCSNCGQNMWGKPTAEVICGVCYREEQKIIFMEIR